MTIKTRVTQKKANMELKELLEKMGLETIEQPFDSSLIPRTITIAIPGMVEQIPHQRTSWGELITHASGYISTRVLDIGSPRRFPGEVHM